MFEEAKPVISDQQRQQLIIDVRNVAALSSENPGENINKILTHQHPMGAMRAFYLLRDNDKLGDEDAQTIFDAVMTCSKPMEQARGMCGLEQNADPAGEAGFVVLDGADGDGLGGDPSDSSRSECLML